MTFANNVKLNGTTTNLYAYDSESRTISFTPEPIKPGQKIQYEFDVTIDEGSEGKYFTNVAVLHDGDTATVTFQVRFENDGATDNYPNTAQRGKLLGGKTLDEASANLSEAWPRDEWYADPVLFMGAIKCLGDADIDYSLKTANKDYYTYKGVKRMVATREQLGRMIKAVGLDTGLVSPDFSSTDPSKMTGRSTFASEMAKILNRDENPDFNNCERPVFSDANSSLVSEMSIFHSYVLKGKNTSGEIWTFSNANRGVPI